jgi:hypothetical protein
MDIVPPYLGIGHYGNLYNVNRIEEIEGSNPSRRTKFCAFPPEMPADQPAFLLLLVVMWDHRSFSVAFWWSRRTSGTIWVQMCSNSMVIIDYP